jgi:hypothetical protein
MKSEKDNERQQENKRAVEIEDLPVAPGDVEAIAGGVTHYAGTANGGVWKTTNGGE